jgi:hypothetical protein
MQTWIAILLLWALGVPLLFVACASLCQSLQRRRLAAYWHTGVEGKAATPAKRNAFK